MLNMGQSNSCHCSSHYLPTTHPNEGYCSLCRERFTNLQGRDAPGEYKPPVHALGKKPPSGNKSKLERHTKRPANSPQSSQQAFVKKCWELEPDLIYKCDKCPSFFYSVSQLVDHMVSPEGVHTRTSLLNRHGDSNGPWETCEYVRPCHTLERVDSTLLHLQRREISKKDSETERQHVCCVRCGIYFTSKERRRKHFRDVDRYIMRLEAEVESIWNDASREDHYDSDDSDEYPSAALFPMPPSTLPIPALMQKSSLSQPRVPVTGRLSRSVSLDASCITELPATADDLRHPLRLVDRLGPPYTHSNSSASSGFSATTDRTKGMSHDFECPLCLESESEIASLPCGHVFGSSCIHKSLGSDPRCPLCRRAAEPHNALSVRQACRT